MKIKNRKYSLQSYKGYLQTTMLYIMIKDEKSFFSEINEELTIPIQQCKRNRNQLNKEKNIKDQVNCK